ncbi:sulfotransferase family protein [Dyella choica]|uniref:Sulfotransferase n=1 Tax=Dyella choica TaxID=1927959 RepID=A0A3S0PJ38_9GAMM|nr:sulfotransferase [Dyella choica]RUL70415.1 sulfotransferase [Dyella choica]
MQVPQYPVHFISGLPRSGSTLLSAILKQNQRFSAGMSSPVASLFNAVLPKMSGASEYAPFFDEGHRHRVLNSLFGAYHHDAIESGKFVFDTNRTWTAKLSLLHELFPRARVICCVREVSWVIDSVEQLIRRNPTHVSEMFQSKSARNVYGRVKDLMDSERGLIGLPWGSLREAWFGEHADKLIFLRYESLVRDPVNVMARLYDFLGEAHFKHDFNNVEFSEDEFDRRLGMPGLHTVKRKVEQRFRSTLLPPDIFMKYADMNFWENDKLNMKKVAVL